MRVHADIENARCVHETSNRFTKVVLPEPDGAVITMIFPLVKFKNYMRIKQKKTAYANNESIKKEAAMATSSILYKFLPV